VASPPSLPLPEPSLGDGAVRLRRWGAVGDAGALVAAWSDPDIQRWTAVPPAKLRGRRNAERWIAGEEERRRAGISLDLVISPAEPDDDTVLGEVGLAPIDWETMTAHIGWWVAAPARGQGIATRAVRLLARWAEHDLGLRVVAEIDPANAASRRVAERAAVEVVEVVEPVAEPAADEV
jgi:RimJ/RimL family protein N-acetyltransferase